MSTSSLQCQLRQYRIQEVNIPQDEQTRAKETVEKIKGVFQGLQLRSPFDFRQIFHQGSFYEGLKVIAADEFDLLVPLKVKTDGWIITSPSEGGLSGYYRIEEQSSSSGQNEACRDLIVQGCLSPAHVRQNMQSIVQKTVDGMNLDMRINLSYSGPAITLNVEYNNGSRMSIDLVPCLQLNGRHFVAKSPKSQSGIHDQLWRESFSEKEKAIFNNIDRMNECHRDCLKILKTIQKKRGSSQLGMLSSYHLKTCMLHLKDRPALSWHQDKLADRFKDLVQTLMRFLDDSNMPHYFCRSVNLLDQYGVDSTRLKNILGWLRGATRDDQHIIDVLLEREPVNMIVAGPRRNPDEAEEDDIGPFVSTSPIGCQRRRGSLLIELRRYYHDHAAIPVQRRKGAKAVVEDVKRSLQGFINSDSDLRRSFGSFVYHGSSYEGLSVMEPKFNLLLPLKTKNSEWRYQEADIEQCRAPGYFLIKKSTPSMATDYDYAVVNDIYLNPITIHRKMQSIIQRGIVNGFLPNVERVTLKEHSPALRLDVRCDLLRMNIDIIPSVKLKDVNNSYRLFVAKRHPDADQYQCPSRNDQNLYNHIWRESFSEQEKEIIRNIDGKNECHRACLKILKTIRKRNGSSQLGILSSYHLKICMLHLNEDTDYMEPWHQDLLDDRFKDLLWKLLEFIAEKNMPSFFAPTVNLLARLNATQLQNIEGWLRRIIQNEKIIDVLLSDRDAEPPHQISGVYGAETLERRREAPARRRAEPPEQPRCVVRRPEPQQQRESPNNSGIGFWRGLAMAAAGVFTVGYLASRPNERDGRGDRGRGRGRGGE